MRIGFFDSFLLGIAHVENVKFEFKILAHNIKVSTDIYMYEMFM